MAPLMGLKQHSDPPKTTSIKTNLKHPKSNKRRKKCQSGLECLVCGDSTGGKNFGAVSCLACAAFFRLSIVQQRNYLCRQGRQCAVDKINRTGCRSCRLEKCLQIGMRKEMVRFGGNEEKGNDVAEDVESVELPFALQEMASPAPSTVHQAPSIEFQKEMALLNSLLHMESQYRRVNNSKGELPTKYFQQFGSLDHLLLSESNLLAMANSLSGIPPVWDRQKCLEQVDKNGIFAVWPVHRMADHFLNADMAKTLPFFGRLQLQDRIRLLCAINTPIVYLCNFFYSAQKKAETVVKSDGLVPVAIIHQTKRYGSDPRLVEFTKRIYIDALTPFRHVRLSVQEFVLVLAILFSTSSVSGLSEEAQHLLYAESSKFSGLLLRLLQSQLGLLPGVQRFGEIVRLIGVCFQVADLYSTYSTYLDVFHLGGNRQKRLPKVLQPLYSVQ